MRTCALQRCELGECAFDGRRPRDDDCVAACVGDAQTAGRSERRAGNQRNVVNFEQIHAQRVAAEEKQRDAHRHSDDHSELNQLSQKLYGERLQLALGNTREFVVLLLTCR